MVKRIKSWVPSQIPLRNDLPAWKSICLDIHNHMISAGLVQTVDAGQLDINAVLTLPADGSYAGYRMYRFDDATQSLYPILIKLAFGCNLEGLSSSGYQRDRTISIVASVGTNTDGNGNLLGIKTPPITSPQAYSYSSTIITQLTSPGTSYITYNEDRGFFGFVYGAGSRNNPSHPSGGGYYGASLALFIQRTRNASGLVDGRGASILGPNLVNYTNATNYPNSSPTFSNTSIVYNLTDVLLSSQYAGTLVGSSGSRAFGGEVGLQPLYTETPYVQPWETLLSYYRTDIPDNSQITVNGTNYITVGGDTGIVLDIRNNWNSCLAMIFEGDLIP